MSNQAIAEIDERRGATSASNAEADARCSGRHLAQRGIPDSSSEDSAFGDRIHAALAAQDSTGLKLDEVSVYDRCREIESRKLVEFFGQEGAMKVRSFREDPKDPAKSRIWVRIQMGAQTLEHSARPDVFHRLGDRALIVEYKTLLGEVPESPKNRQLRDQEVLIRRKYLVGGEIGVVVVQPLVENNPQICVYTPDHSRTSEEEMFRRVIASNSMDSPRVPGDLQCKYCKAARAQTCIEYQKFAGQGVPSMLTLLDVPVHQWTPEQRAIFCDRLSIAQKWLDDTKEVIKEGLKDDPAYVTGWTLEAGAKRETITNPQVCFERFTAIGGTTDQFMAAITVAKTKLKTAINAATGAKGAKLDAAVKTLTEGITEMNQNAPSLKRVVQKEPSV